MSFGAKILIVEDEAIEAMDIQQRLARMGYPLPVIAHSGKEGVRKVEEAQPDLVLMDIMMPGKMDGVAAAEQIRSRFDIPIIFLTAYADEKTLQRAKITVPYGYIVKPFQERELHIAVDIALYRHKMERKLREREKWFATTLRSIGDAVIATDKTGLITFMNPVAEEMTGWKLEEVLQRNLTEVFNIINRDTRLPAENPVTRVIHEGNILGLANHTILKSRQGKEIPINDSAAPIKDEKGDILGVILVFSDMTDREKAQAELKEANAELGAVNRELESFIYSVSHDLRAPLRTMAAFVSFLRVDYSERLDEQAKDYLIRISRSSAKMNKLVEDLLDLSRLSRKEVSRTKVNMSVLAASIVSGLRQAEPGRSIAISIEDGLNVSADPSLMEIVLSNLIGNAWKFTSKTEKAEIEFGSLEKEGETVYYVRDNGAGFDSRHATKMFLPFHRLHSDIEFEGTGIGLSIVERIIHSHKGKVWAEGKSGKGATVYFTLG
jgi:two-component system, cell cycle sensor histidine kinase and response regulator CckA